jgi:ABC-2 type transport system permease protein
MNTVPMNGLVGTRALTRLALRRDRIMLPVWIVILGLLPPVSVPAYEQFYPTQASRDMLAAGAARNPSLNVLYGQPFDISTPGGFTAYRYAGFLAIFVALMCIFTVTRHTRAEEETGRLELLGAGVVGRYAALTAAVLVAAGAAVLTGLLIAFGLMANGLPSGGAFAFGASMTLVGLAFTGVAAFAAQLTEYARSCNGIAGSVLGIAFLLRAVGDSSDDLSWLSWVSPIGWAQQTRSFAGERWWVLALAGGAAVLVTAAAYLMQPRRDIGAGVFPPRPGPAAATAGLRSPFALAWRMHRVSLFGWIVAMAVFGAVFGSIANGIGDLVGGSEQTRAIFERMGGAQGIVDAFLATIGGFYGLIAAVYATTAALRMRSEETAVRLEPLLATGVRRWRWMASHLVFALLGSALLLAVAGAATGLAHGIAVGDVGGKLPDVLLGTVAQIPPTWVVVGIVAVLFGVLPQFASFAWVVLSVFVLLAMFGPAIQLDQAVMDVSPFTHVPKLPGSDFTATPLLWLTGIAAVALAAGFVTFRRRDIG